MDNIQIKTGNTAEDFWKLASGKGFVQSRQGCSKAFSDIGLAQIKRDWV
jgi:hypothetical protein